MPTPKLKFSPLAWLHYQFLCHAGPTEVGAFGVHAPGDPFLIEWLWVPRQECSAAFVQADKEAWEDYLLDDNRIAFHGDQPVRPVWLHTHPGNSASPSGFDEKNWREEYSGRSSPLTVFGILARGGETYGRTHVHAAGDMAVNLPFEVLWDRLPAELEEIRQYSAGWAAEYAAKVTEKKYEAKPFVLGHGWDFSGFGDGQIWERVSRRERLDAEDRLDERGAHPRFQVFTGDVDEPAGRGRPLAEVLSDDSDDGPTPSFESWVEEYYEVNPGQLDHANLAQVRDEYLEYYPNEPLCDRCAYPLDEEELATGKLCFGCVREDTAWERYQADIEAIDERLDNEERIREF